MEVRTDLHTPHIGDITHTSHQQHTTHNALPTPDSQLPTPASRLPTPDLRHFTVHSVQLSTPNFDVIWSFQDRYRYSKLCNELRATITPNTHYLICLLTPYLDSRHSSRYAIFFNCFRSHKCNHIISSAPITCALSKMQGYVYKS